MAEQITNTQNYYGVTQITNTQNYYGVTQIKYKEMQGFNDSQKKLDWLYKLCSKV